MAIVHRATVSPTKQDLVTAWLDRQEWGGSGAVEMLGGYRFDDPQGEVGVEALLVRRGEDVLHVPLSYRGAPLLGAEGHLVTTMQHSVLGDRWIYEAAADPVARGCFMRALRGEQEQAATEVWDDGRFVELREPTVRVVAEAGTSRTDAGAPGTLAGELVLAHVVDDRLDGPRRLVASWPAGRGIVAVLVGEGL